MPPVVIGGLIAAAGSIGGAAIASHVAGKAADQEQQANNQAIGLQQQQFQRAQTALAPFQPGAGIYAPLQSRVTSQPGQGAFGGLQSYGAQASPSASAAMPATSTGMVTLRAPNGMTKQVPASQAAHYQQRGATVVG